jgi:beta-xylosidase
MIDCKFVKPDGPPIEAYAPAVMALDGALYYTACNVGLYRTTDPKGGKWEYIGEPFDVGDPDLFADEDGRVYLYDGLSYNGGIYGLELDPKNQFRSVGQPFLCFRANYAQHGWERRGEDNLGAANGSNFQEGPWIEGSWMTKHAGTYYLQYAAPGTEFRSYADGYTRLRARAGLSLTLRTAPSLTSRPASLRAPDIAQPSPTNRDDTGT